MACADETHNDRNHASPEVTPLRALETRARSLSLESQMSECVDVLQLPEFFAEEVEQSVAQVRSLHDKPAQDALQLVSHSADVADSEAFFYPSRELFVLGEGCSFTCLGTDLEFVSGETSDAPVDLSATPPAIDYAAVTCESRPFPVIGFTQRSAVETAYPLLLRGLAGVIELLQPRRFDLLEREVYRGLLGPAPVFDLALVLWDDESKESASRPICELTRDLAEVLKLTLAKVPSFPPVLNDIVCLRMNDKRFDGRLRFAWRV